jgi:hypothetical protein
MLTQEGNFPCHKITDRYIEKDFGEDELHRSHTTFLWIFRTSRHWSAVRDLIPGMLHYLESDQSARKYRPGRASPASDSASEITLNFSGIFKQLFCVTAAQLAGALHEALDNIGVLFEEPLETGTLHLFKVSKQLQGRTETDVESDASNLGRGKYLFLNRQLTKDSADRFAAMGYRFASIDHVAELIARNMDVKPERMMAHLERMKTAVMPDVLQPRGVHVGCFMVRPSIHQSFDILVPAKSQNQLPMVSLKLYLLTTWHRQILEKYDERPLGEVLRTLHRQSHSGAAERDFIYNLHAALLQLVDDVGEMAFMVNAILSVKAIEIRPSQSANEGDSDRCTILTVRIMNDIHAKPPAGMRYVPLGFFGAQQLIEAGDPVEKLRWEQRVRSEFGHFSAAPSTPNSPWAKGSRHQRRSAAARKSFLGFLPWVSHRDGRKGSYATDGSSRRDSTDDQARIVKTVEIDLKEEKDDSAPSTMDVSIDDVSRLASAASDPSMSNSSNEDDTTITTKLERTRTEDDNFERQQCERGAYKAKVEGINSSAVASKQARSGALSVNTAKKTRAEVEMVELGRSTSTPGAAMAVGPEGAALNLRGGGWVSEVFSMFRL